MQVFRGKKSAGLALFFVIALLAASANAQFNSDALSKPWLSGNLEHDFFSYQHFSGEKNSPVPGLELEHPVAVSHKSPFLAGALSFILPGLGEYYVGDQIWRGIIFTAIDAGLLYGALLHNSHYNDSLNAWHDFANVHFLPCVYADSLNQQLSKFDKSFRISDCSDFSQINRAEDSLFDVIPNMTHNLPAKGSVEYYKVISKYIQFTPGWDDNTDGNPDHSPHYQRTRDLTANAGHEGDLVTTFVDFMLLNRVLSVIDAVLLATNHNSRIHLEGELQQKQYPDGTMGFIPTAKMQYRF